MLSLNVLSALLLLLFFALLGGRTRMLARRGIKAIVFGQTDKSDFFLIPVFLLFIYAVFACAFSLPIPSALVRPFWNLGAVGWLGLFFCAGALVGFFLSLRSFGDSFRVGIDENSPDKLVTTGMFAHSRNPIYVSFLLFFGGLFFIYPNPLLAGIVLLFSFFIPRQICREEAFLKAHYGRDYDDYCKRVGRYF